jgi:hypothetical protein
MEAIHGNSLDATKARMLGTDASQDANPRMFQSKRRQQIGGVRWPHQQNSKEVAPAGTVKNSPELCAARQRVSFVPLRAASRPNVLLKPSLSQKKLNPSWSTTSTTAPTMTPSNSEIEFGAAGSDFSSTGAYTPPPSDSTPQRRGSAASERRNLRPRLWR